MLDNTKPLGNLANTIAGINEANGWYEKARTFGEDIALLHSEITEAFEEYRNGHAPDERYYSFNGKTYDLPTGEGLGFKPEGVPSELADMIVRVLDTCFRYGIDIDAVLEEKIKFNATRGYRHGGKVI